LVLKTDGLPVASVEVLDATADPELASFLTPFEELYAKRSPSSALVVDTEDAETHARFMKSGGPC
jgi:hypothetical protein